MYRTFTTLKFIKQLLRPTVLVRVFPCINCETILRDCGRTKRSNFFPQFLLNFELSGRTDANRFVTTCLQTCNNLCVFTCVVGKGIATICKTVITEPLLPFRIFH